MKKTTLTAVTMLVSAVMSAKGDYATQGGQAGGPSFPSDSTMTGVNDPASSVPAGDISVAEPEFLNSYCILTGNGTYDVLPKENGRIGEIKNKSGRLFNKIGKVAGVAGTVGGLTAAVGGAANSFDGMVGGLKTMGVAGGVGGVAGAANALTAANGMDIVFAGPASAYSFDNKGQDVRILIKVENNEEDPANIYRIARFRTTKRDRRVKWMEWGESAFVTKDGEDKGFVYFTAHKYGEQSYLITIPASQLEEGEYGIFYMGLVTAETIPVGTFGIH